MRTALASGVASLLSIAGFFAAQVQAQLPAESELRGAEEHTVATLPPPGPHTVYVVDPVFPHLIASKVYVVDGDKRDIIGMLNTGYLPNLVLTRNGGALYVAETFWSRGSRGSRTDVVTFYDPRTLVPSGEAQLPRGRYLVVPKKPDAGLTSDGRYLLSFNMAPAMSVSVVDVKGRRYLGEIETPGCALVFPSGASRFSSICSDGSMLTATFDESGRATAKRSSPFFDPKRDPVFEPPGHGARGMTYFVSYDGMVYPVDMSGNDPAFGAAWSLLERADADEGWRPGGWQLAAVHRDRNLLFVLMHKGPRWTHKQAGEEVWAVDLGTKKRVGRIPLEHHAITVAVSQDATPQLYTLSETAKLSIFDVNSRQHLGTMDGVGETPFLVHVHGE
jgi:methylamine dehydrogenase heavy chain